MCVCIITYIYIYIYMLYVICYMLYVICYMLYFPCRSIVLVGLTSLSVNCPVGQLACRSIYHVGQLGVGQ